MENWGRLSHLFVTAFLSNLTILMVNPAITDVMVEAVCSGKDECSLAIYLTGFQQAISGLGSVMMMPLIGNLSDVYGRKTLLTVPLTLAIIPLVILAWDRTTNFFYAYYVFKTLTAMVTDGGLMCLALGYLADNVSEGKRVSAFGVLTGVCGAATVCGTLAARLLSTARIFQVAAAISIVAAVYMRIFLKEPSHCSTDSLQRPIMTPETENNQICSESSKKKNSINNIPSPKDIMCYLKTSTTFSLVASVSFFNSLAEAGLEAFLLYYLKARFNFKKDQFADVLLIDKQENNWNRFMVFLPLLGPVIGEKRLLVLGLFSGFLNMFLDSIAWSAWVPFAASLLGVFFSLSAPSLRSIASKEIGPDEQGIAQGCILGVSSFANLVSPLIFSPLSALFLSDNAPFHFPGFSIFCVGLAYFIGLILSMMIKINPPSERSKVKDCLLA